MDTNDAETAVNAYNTLMGNGMQILLGTVTTTPALAVVPYTLRRARIHPDSLRLRRRRH